MSIDRDLARAVRGLDEHELRRLLIYAGGLLESTSGQRFAFEEGEKDEKPVSVRQQMVKCSKANCRSCPHGPYWYAYWRENGKVRSRYIGRHLPEGMNPSGDGVADADV